MKNLFNEMSMIEKVILVGQILEHSEGMERPLRRCLSRRPYSPAFVIEISSMEAFKELSNGNGFTYYKEAIEATTIYELDQLGTVFYDEIKQFVNFIVIQD